MRARKYEPLSNLRAKNVWVTEKGGLVTIATPFTPGIETVRTASLDTSIEEINPWSKRQRTGDKQKKNVDSRSSIVWDNARVALSKVQGTFIVEDMKVFLGVSANEVVGCHLHKIVQVPM